MKAVIFDMDGVISNTQQIHAIAEEKIMSFKGINLSATELIEKYDGLSDKKTFKKISEEYKIPLNIEEMIEHKWENIYSSNKKKIKPIEGVIDLIVSLKKQNYKLAVASSSPSKFIKIVLSALNIENKFDSIVSSEQVIRGKPFPDIFLLASKNLNVEPEQCAVIEDSFYGMLAAKRANMFCIGFINNYSEKNNKEIPADLIISDFNEIKINELK